MGYATIVGELGDGRYTVELDFGEAQRVALLASIAQALVVVGEKIVEATEKVAVADAAKAAQQVVVNAAAATLQAQANNLPPGSPVPDTAVYDAEVTRLLEIELAGEPRRIVLRTLKQSQKNLLAKQTQYTNLVCIERRNAWCCDLTEGGEGIVATVDIPGESDLILVAPGCRAWAAGDGQFRERDLMSPEQCYYNAAVLPTWQKYMPTYRWGTITFIDHELNIVNLNLHESTSSANAPLINVNQTPQLNGVTVQYMSCNSRAFDVGDDVIVQFIGKDWALPVVVGFLDNPKPCGFTAVGLAGYGWVTSQAAFITKSVEFADAVFDANAVVEGRLNSGAWFALPISTFWTQIPNFQRIYEYRANYGANPSTPDDFPQLLLTVQRDVQNFPGYPAGWFPTAPPSGTVGVINIGLETFYGSTGEVFEVRIIVDGELKFNAAATTQFRSPVYARNRDGFFQSWGYVLEELEDYQLFSDV
jgi:hypothetical protein